MLSAISNSLKKSINRAGIRKQVDAARSCNLWRAAIEEIFTPEIARKSHALSCKNGVMTVAVLSSVFAQEFKFKEEEIIEKINEKMGENIVKRIKYEL